MDESKRDILRYLNGFGAQHRTKPGFIGLASALLEKVDASHAVAKSVPLDFDIYHAVGAQLDVIGQLVGADRRFPLVDLPDQPNLLDDESYRQIILARIVQNQWDGSYERFHEIWDTTLGGILDATYRDNQDMSMDVSVKGMLSPTLKELIFHGYFLPKPMGVSIKSTVTSENPEMTCMLEASGFMGRGYMQTILPEMNLDAERFTRNMYLAPTMASLTYTRLPEMEEML